jgi:hypothetical protein
VGRTIFHADEVLARDRINFGENAKRREHFEPEPPLLSRFCFRF